MSGEVSYLSRFFVKLVEIVAAGLASAISAYLLAHFVEFLPSSPTPASAPIAPSASELTESVRVQPTPPVPTAAVKERRPTPQQDTDAPAAQPTPKVGKDAKALPPGRQTKSDTSMAARGPPGNKSTEALIRDALANVDAKQPALPEPLIAPGLTDPRSVPVDMQPRQTGAPPRRADEPWRVDDPSRSATTKAAPPAADIPVQPRSATGPDRQPRFPDARATIDPLPRSSPPQIAAPQPPRSVDQDKDVFYDLKRIPDLLRPEPPATSGEAPRPPMPVGTAPPE
jgi:hypothetical protein